MIEQHRFTDRAEWLRLRQQDVTASVAGALLGVHEYQTPYGLWALKSGQIEEDQEETPPMRRGRLLEPVAIKLLEEERPTWKVNPNTTYFRDPMNRIGATPDAFAKDPERDGFGIVQVKTVEASIFRRKWINSDTGEVELPLWIAVQAIVEAHLTKAQWACVTAMVVSHGIDLQVIEVPIHEGILERLRDAVHEFWGLVESGRSPDPGYARDGAVIARLFDADQGTETDLSQDNHLPILIDERDVLKAEIKQREERCAEIETEFKAKIGNHATAYLADGRRVTWKTQHRSAYSVGPKSFRVLRFPKSK